MAYSFSQHAAAGLQSQLDRCVTDYLERTGRAPGAIRLPAPLLEEYRYNGIPIPIIVMELERHTLELAPPLAGEYER